MYFGKFLKVFESFLGSLVGDYGLCFVEFLHKSSFLWRGRKKWKWVEKYSLITEYGEKIFLICCQAQVWRFSKGMWKSSQLRYSLQEKIVSIEFWWTCRRFSWEFHDETKAKTTRGNLTKIKRSKACRISSRSSFQPNLHCRLLLTTSRSFSEIQIRRSNFPNCKEHC